MLASIQHATFCLFCVNYFHYFFRNDRTVYYKYTMEAQFSSNTRLACQLVHCMPLLTMSCVYCFSLLWMLRRLPIDQNDWTIYQNHIMLAQISRSDILQCYISYSMLILTLFYFLLIFVSFDALVALNVSKLPNCIAKLHSCSMNKLHYLAKYNAWLLYTPGVSRKSKIYDMIGKKQLSHFTCHMSHITCHLYLSGI